MEQNYFDKEHSEKEPRPIVIKRILSYSKYYKHLVKDQIEAGDKP